jgi:hypothetical protein
MATRRRRRVRPNAPELRKVHAGLEAAYLAAIARKDKTSQALARRIKGPWMRVEKLLKRGGSFSRRRNPANPSVWVRRSAVMGSDLYYIEVDGTPISRDQPRAQALKGAESLGYGTVKVEGAASVKLPRGARKRNPRTRRKARRRNPAVKRSSSRGRELVAFTVKRGGRAVGKVLATTAIAAAKEAKASGLQLGRELKGEFCRTNPPRGAVLSERAESVTYQHEQDGEWYKHKFAPGVVIKVSPNKKRVTLYRPDGKPVAGNFWVP